MGKKKKQPAQIHATTQTEEFGKFAAGTGPTEESEKFLKDSNEGAQEAKEKQKPTMKQMGRFFELIKRGIVTRDNFQYYMQQPDRFCFEDNGIVVRTKSFPPRTFSDLINDTEPGSAVAVKTKSVPPPPAVKLTVAGELSAIAYYESPKYEDLLLAYDRVDNYYKDARFRPNDRCAEISRINRQLRFMCLIADRVTYTRDLIAEMGNMNLRPIAQEELISFTAQHPEVQRKRSIAALGSLCDGREGIDYVAIASEENEKLCLGFGWESEEWDESLYYFIAVPIDD